MPKRNVSVLAVLLMVSSAVAGCTRDAPAPTRDASGHEPGIDLAHNLLVCDSQPSAIAAISAIQQELPCFAGHVIGWPRNGDGSADPIWTSAFKVRATDRFASLGRCEPYPLDADELRVAEIASAQGVPLSCALEIPADDGAAHPGRDQSLTLLRALFPASDGGDTGEQREIEISFDSNGAVSSAVARYPRDAGVVLELPGAQLSCFAGRTLCASNVVPLI